MKAELNKSFLEVTSCILTKYRRHTDPNGGYDQNEIKRNKALNYFKQNCRMQFLIPHVFLVRNTFTVKLSEAYP